MPTSFHHWNLNKHLTIRYGLLSSLYMIMAGISYLWVCRVLLAWLQRWRYLSLLCLPWVETLKCVEANSNRNYAARTPVDYQGNFRTIYWRQGLGRCKGSAFRSWEALPQGRTVPSACRQEQQQLPDNSLLWNMNCCQPTIHPPRRKILTVISACLHCSQNIVCLSRGEWTLVTALIYI